MTKNKTSFALSEEALEKLRDLSKKRGISMSSVLEMLIRKEAGKEGIDGHKTAYIGKMDTSG